MQCLIRFPDCIKSAVKAGAWLQPGCLAGWVVGPLECTRACSFLFVLWTLCSDQAQILPAVHLKFTAPHAKHNTFDGQIRKPDSLENTKGQGRGYKVGLIGKWPRDTLRKVWPWSSALQSLCSEQEWWYIFLMPYFLPLWVGHIA